MKAATAHDKEESPLEDCFSVAGKIAEFCLDGKHTCSPREAQPATMFCVDFAGRVTGRLTAGKGDMFRVALTGPSHLQLLCLMTQPAPSPLHTPVPRAFSS